MIKKKKLKLNGKPKLRQVFDWTKMPLEFNGIETTDLITGREGAINDSYHRWYPDRITEKEIGEYDHFKDEAHWKAGKQLQKWLLSHGLKIKDEFCFHVLIHISW